MTSSKSVAKTALATAFAVLLLMLSMCSAQSIVAVDPGINYMKVVLVQPGKVFDIALSPDSKRKTFTGVAIVDGVRSFGSESFNVYGKKPQNTVWRVRDLLGRSPNDPELLNTLKKHHLTQHQLMEADDGTGAIRINFAQGTKDAAVYAPEELFAMILNHCKENGERHGTTKVGSLSITVPMYFSQPRRQGMVDAVDITGMSLLGLVDENGAAAIQYAVDRSFNETGTNVLFFNMGAGSTQVSIVQITGGKEKRSGKEFRNIKVLSKAWDEHLGAEDLDLVLARLFATEFDEKHPSTDSKIIDAPRAIVRLKKEARQVKEILSGLDKFPVSFQSLHRDVDFKSLVTRAQMEELAKDVLARVTAPVERALKYASMTVKDLHLVEVVGGGFRVPGVRDALRKVIPAEIDLSTHVNGDEGMAFGAAFCAANVSSTFHVPRIATFQDATPREIRFLLKGDDMDRDVSLFPRFTLVEAKEPVKQVVKFRHDKDFKVTLVEKKSAEDDPAAFPESTAFAEYEVSGMKGAMESFGKFGEPKVHLSFTVDRSLMASLIGAEARFDEEYEEIVKTPNATTSAGDSNATTSDEKPSEGAEKNETTVVKKTRKHVFALTLKRTDASVPIKKMTTEAKAKSQVTIKKMDEEDRARARREEARNALESFSFVTREKLDTHEADVKLVTDSNALEELKRELSQVEDWIDDHKQASAEEFAQEKARISTKVDKIFHLIKEHQERPAAIKAFRGLIRALEDRRANWTAERPWITEKVWEVVDKAQSDALAWADEMEQKQSKLTPKDDPALSIALIRQEMEKIQKMVELLLKQRKPLQTEGTASKKGKKAESSSSSSSSTDDAKSSQEEAKGDKADEAKGEEELKEEPKAEGDQPQGENKEKEEL